MKKVINEDMVRGPASQVRLVNLGTKAVPFGPEEGEVRIATRLRTRFGVGAGDCLEILHDVE